MLRINHRLQIPLEELKFTFVRSSGPGGQNVNKVSSKAVLEWPVMSSPSLPDDVRERFVARYGNRISQEGVLQITSQRFRDQSKNIEDCREKLRLMVLAVATPPRPRKKTRPSRAQRERRLEAKHHRSRTKRERRAAPD